MPDDVQHARPPMELRDYLAVFRRRWVAIVLVTLVVVIVGVYRSKQQPSVYQAQGSLLIQSDQPDAVATEATIIESNAVHLLALQSDPSVGEVATETGLTTSVINVLAESTSPKNAADTVNAHMNAYVDYTKKLQVKRYTDAVAALAAPLADLDAKVSDLDRQLQALPNPATNPAASVLTQQRDSLLGQRDALKSRLLTLQFDTTLAANGSIVIVATADPPTTPISPKPVQDGIIALGAGLLLGIALAFLLEYLDDSIKTRDDLRRAVGDDVPVLGVIPNARSSRPDVISIRAPHSVPAEAYRSLRTSVYFVGVDRGSCFEITSARSQEGKSQTAANLAVVAARAGNDVILIDCDLRRPTIHHYFNLRNDVGFTSVILGTPLEEALQQIPGVEGLSVLTSGPLPPNPSELLASDRFREVLAKVKTESTFVLIDTPPVLAVTDAVALAASVDSVLFVARAGFSARRQSRSAIDVLHQLGAPLVGSVLVGVKDGPQPDRYYAKAHRHARFKNLFGRSNGDSAPSREGTAVPR